MPIKGPITIRLVAVPNVDFGETALGIRAESIEVVHFAEASLVLRKWVEKHGLGAGNMGKHCGEIRAAGKLVARVSYNGRLWDLDGKEIRPGVFDAPPANAHPTTKAIHARYAINPEEK